MRYVAWLAAAALVLLPPASAAPALAQDGGADTRAVAVGVRAGVAAYRTGDYNCPGAVARTAGAEAGVRRIGRGWFALVAAGIFMHEPPGCTSMLRTERLDDGRVAWVIRGAHLHDAPRLGFRVGREWRLGKVRLAPSLRTGVTWDDSNAARHGRTWVRWASALVGLEFRSAPLVAVEGELGFHWMPVRHDVYGIRDQRLIESRRLSRRESFLSLGVRLGR